MCTRKGRWPADADAGEVAQVIAGVVDLPAPSPTASGWTSTVESDSRNSSPPAAASDPFSTHQPITTRRATMPFANIKVPQGTLNATQKEEIIHHVTTMFASYFGDDVRPYTMVLVDEVIDGGWGRADGTLTLAKLGMGDQDEAGGSEKEPPANGSHGAQPA
jgi:4-oxalocrotonate tautomerase